MRTSLATLLLLICLAQAQAQSSLPAAAQAMAAKDFDRARDLLAQALLQKPVSAQAFFMMADLDLQTGHPDQAIAYFERGLRLAPRSFPGHYELALAFLRLQKWSEGQRELETAVQIEPRQPDAVYNLALVLLETGHPREALLRLQQASALAPGHPDLSYNMARAQLNLGRPGEAIQELLKAAAQQPDDRDIQRLLARAYLQSDQPQMVASVLQPAANAEDSFLLATAALATGDLEGAAQDSARSLQQDGNNVRYLLLNARIDQQRNRQQAALQTLDRAAHLAPRSPEVHYSQAVSYYFLGQYERVRRSLDFGDDPKHPPPTARALFLVAMSYENEGKPDEAINYLKKAVVLEPANGRFQCHLGVALLQKQQVPMARHAFAEAIRLDPNFALPHFELGKLMARENQPSAAAREMETATRLQPDLAPALYELSRVYRTLGQTQPATDTMARFLALKARQTAEQEELASDTARQLQSP